MTHPIARCRQCVVRHRPRCGTSTVCACLGARDTSEQQIRLAFELNRHRILRAVGPFSEMPYQGETIPVPVENL
ncbi:hypothetical protein DF153_31475 [Burkholderia cenocepacia]|nr:hypothetical protein DF152_32455 [Burkholderia cenocepacia]RQU13727.1 hypothetical protein DF153_31475 [Burkholderia cenocepacia]